MRLSGNCVLPDGAVLVLSWCTALETVLKIVCCGRAKLAALKQLFQSILKGP